MNLQWIFFFGGVVVAIAFGVATIARPQLGGVLAQAGASAKGLGWLVKNLRSVLFVLIAGLLAWRALFTPGPPPGEVGSFAWDRVVTLIGVWLAGATFIALSQKGSVAKTLQSLLTVVMLLLLVVFPLMGHAGVGNSPTQMLVHQSQICPDMSARETRSCLIGTTWSNWIRPAEGTADNGLHPCLNPGGEWQRKSDETTGITLVRFRTSEGTMNKFYRLFPPTVSCAETQL